MKKQIGVAVVSKGLGHAAATSRGLLLSPTGLMLSFGLMPRSEAMPGVSIPNADRSELARAMSASSLNATVAMRPPE